MTNTERYAARLDAHLATLPDDAARRQMLESEKEKWIGRQQRFQLLVDSGLHEGLANAADYQITLADIGQRLAKLRETS